MTYHILVIDNEQSIRELFRLILEPEGYHVILSPMICEDVTSIEHLKPDLIILDCQLGRPEKGFLLLQHLKMSPPTEAIPVILCTTTSRNRCNQEEVLRQKEIPILYKPFEIDEVLQTVHEFLPVSSSAKEEEHSMLPEQAEAGLKDQPTSVEQQHILAEREYEQVQREHEQMQREYEQVQREYKQMQ